MKNLREKFPIVLFWGIFAAFLFAGLYYEFKMWEECRRDNSILYCMRVLQR